MGEYEFLNQPWFWLFLIYFLIEIISLFKFGQDIFTLILKHFFDISVFSLGEDGEIGSEILLHKFCALLVSSCFCIIAGIIFYIFHLAFTSKDGTFIIFKCIVLFIIMIPITFETHRINRRYIAQK